MFKPMMFSTTATSSERKRDDKQKCAVLRKHVALFANDVRAHGSAGQQQAGKIKNRVNPVRPAGDKTVKIAESFLGPDV